MMIELEQDVLSDLELMRNEDGTYVDKDGCHNDNLYEALGTVLGICGCGDPSDTINLVGESLQIISDNSDGETWEVYNRRMKALLGNERSFLLMLYFLDKEGLAEHGGSVFGCWLTSKGHSFLAAQKQASQDPEAE